MKLSNLTQDLWAHLAANPRTIYILLTLTALVLAAAATTKWAWALG